MLNYLIRRILLIIPTLWVILTINFFIIQAAPGGPVDQAIANMQGLTDGSMARISGNNQNEVGASSASNGDLVSRGNRGLDPEVIEAIKKRYGFDKPLLQRYGEMLWQYLRFDFGDSLFKGNSVMELINQRMPVSISLGVWSTLLIYLISIPLGIRKALVHGSKFDIWSSSVVIIGYAIPSFLFGFVLIILFAGSSYWSWFPLRGLTSNNFEELSAIGKITDYFWHMALPVTAMVIGGFATLTMLTKNAFLDEVRKQYVITARSKGLTDHQVLYGHVFRNAMLLIIAGFPSMLIGMLFTGSLLIEVMFSLEGLGLLGYEATLQRDYPVMFTTLYLFTLLGLLLGVLSDFTYTLVDPRIDFEGR
jgi:microcin C transport system permease protein